jgi:hypothetical protein
VCGGEVVEVVAAAVDARLYVVSDGRIVWVVEGFAT